MAKLAKFLQGVAGAGAAGGLNIEDVFSTYLYEGNDGTQTIANGIDLAGEGGLVWIKPRDYAYSHYLYDSERSLTYNLYTNATNGNSTDANDSMDSFNSNGFTITGGANLNASWADYASWTFRKAPKFFDVITYSGTGSNQTISHNLGSTPGTIIVKATNNSDDAWYVWHRSIPQFGSNPQYRSVVFLDSTSAYSNYSIQTAQPDDSNIYVGSTWSTSGYNYVMYVFAHNDGDGGFGPTGDQDIIKCGSFTTDGSGNAAVDLGWEPQFVLWKISNYSADWNIYDSMRGFVASTSGGQRLRPNTSGAESSHNQVRPSATGFDGVGVGGGGPAYNVIYIAIRRGPMAVPESATDVFQVGTVQNNTPKDVSPASDFPVDFVLHHAAANSSTGNKLAINRLANDLLYTNLTGGAYGNYSSYSPFDHMDNVQLTGLGAANGAAWMWKRAPNYFDVVAYHGNSTSGRTVSHNLGVAPEMIWVKNRDSPVDWWCYHKDLGNTKYVKLNTTDAAVTDSTAWNNTTPTDTVITLGNSGRVNYSNDDYIAYLFASLDGVSKVGSYTGNAGASTINVDCGFTNGARFVLIKETSGTGDWWVFDTERGLVAGNDPALKLNTTDAELSADFIDPYSAGFSLQTNSGINTNGATFIFYAIA
jgi:hypothetical protein